MGEKLPPKESRCEECNGVGDQLYAVGSGMGMMGDCQACDGTGLNDEARRKRRERGPWR